MNPDHDGVIFALARRIGTFRRLAELIVGLSVGQVGGLPMGGSSEIECLSTGADWNYQGAAKNRPRGAAIVVDGRQSFA